MSDALGLLIDKVIQKLADQPWRLRGTSASRINKAIEALAGQRAVFSTMDIATYADLEQVGDAIKNAVHAYCENRIIVCSEQQNNAASRRRYLGTRVVRQWWIGLTKRLVELGDVNFLTKNQLAATMSLAFRASPPWNTPPQNLLNIGHRWAMVAAGHKPGTFVFPWAIILRAYPQAKGWFRLNFADEKRLLQLRELSLESVLDKALETLDSREAEVVRSHFGINTDRSTLDKIGKQYDVTRERIRQIEKEALAKLRHHVWPGFAADFVTSKGSLLIPYPLSPHYKLLVRCTDLNITDLLELKKLCVIDIGRETNYQDLSIFPRADAVRINEIREQRLYRLGTRSRPQMLFVALRSLGRAAHYEEIAQWCNQRFPERQCSIQNWHVALSRCAKDETSGIVWIGAKGKYGLKEHGYSRPKTSLHDAVARIVKDIYAEKKTPVPRETVVRELRKQRRELNPNSVGIALNLNDRLETTPNGYIPKAGISEAPPDIPRSRRYDVAAGFRAFATAENGNDQPTGTEK